MSHTSVLSTARMTRNTRFGFAAGLSLLLLLGVLTWVGSRGVLASLKELPLLTFVAIALLILINVFVGSFRFWRILAHQHIDLPWAAVLRANLAGAVAGLFVISLFGQVLGRHVRLREFGVKPVVIAGLAAYERAIVTVVSGCMAALGLIYLLGHPVLSQIIQRISLPQVVIAVLLSSLLGIVIGGSHFDRKLIDYLRSSALYRRVFEIVGLTIINHILILTAFLLAIHVFAPTATALQMFAAAAIISFAASIPISVNGWGVREIAAVFVLSHLGIEETHAVAIAASLGLCSTIVLLSLAPLAIKRKTPVLQGDLHPQVSSIGRELTNDLEKISAWVLAMACAVLIFFQVHVTFPHAAVATDLNLADPFAILALAAASLTAITARMAPRWRLAGFNVALVAITLMLGFSFIHGALSLGVTQWALVSRLMGWFVLLGYLAAGYLLVAVGGQHALRRFAQTMVVGAATVVMLTTFIRLATLHGVAISVPVDFQGYAENRNAFAFQLVVSLIWLLAYSNAQHRHLARTKYRRYFGVWSAVFGVVLFGLYMTMSRAGWIVGGGLLIATWAYRIAPRRDIAVAVSVALVLLLSAYAIANIQYLLSSGTDGHLATNGFLTLSPRDKSNSEHLLSMEKGLAMWRAHPVFGAGLGAFIARSAQWFGRPLVIHSTAIWILAEMGVIGAAVFGAVFYMLARSVWRRALRTERPEVLALALLLAAFAVFSQVHEIFYQRIFWLALGAVLATPFSWRNFGSTSLDKRSNQDSECVGNPNAKKLVFLVTEDWYFCSHRLPLAVAARQAGFDVTVITRVRNHGRLIEDAGVRLIPFEMSRRGINPLREVVTFVRLAYLFHREKPGIVHNIALKPAIHGGLAARLTSVPCVINAVAGLGWMFTSTTRKARLLSYIVPRMLAYALKGSEVIVQNPDDLAQIQKYGIKRLHLIKGAGVDTQRFSPGQAMARAPLVMLASRMLWAKGVGEFVAAAYRLKQQGVGSRFVLVGESDRGNPAAIPDAQLQSWHRTGPVEWWGHKEDMAETWKQATIACLPTYYGEGVPKALLEAAACGLPIVTTDVPGCREIVQNDVNGALVPIKDVGALTEALKKLILDKDLCRRMGEASRDRAAAFAVEGVVEQTMALYRSSPITQEMDQIVATCDDNAGEVS